MWPVVEVQWDIYIQCGRHTCSRAHASNVKYMYTSSPVHIIDCSEFIRGIYTDIVYILMKKYDMCTLSNWHMGY